MPCFSRPALESALKAVRIHYVLLGRELGARRLERECYIGNTVSFDLTAASLSFANGLARLRDGLSRYRIALLCAEKDPLDCHRTILVARHMAEFVKINHILSNGRLETHDETENRLLERYEWKEDELFRSREDRLAEAYARRGCEIAWVESETEDTK